MISMREYIVDAYGLVRDSPDRPYHKGLMGSYFCDTEFQASAVCEQVLLQSRVERVEVRRYNRISGEYYRIHAEFSRDFFSRRGMPGSDVFFTGPVKTSFQSTLDGLGV